MIARRAGHAVKYYITLNNKKTKSYWRNDQRADDKITDIKAHIETAFDAIQDKKNLVIINSFNSGIYLLKYKLSNELCISNEQLAKRLSIKGLGKSNVGRFINFAKLM